MFQKLRIFKYFFLNLSRIAENVNQRIFNVLLHPLPLYKLTKLFREEENAWKKLRTFTTRVINNYKKKEQKMKENKFIEDLNNNDVKSRDDMIELRKPNIFVDKVFELKKKLPDFDNKCLTDEIDTLIAGVW